MADDDALNPRWEEASPQLVSRLVSKLYGDISIDWKTLVDRDERTQIYTSVRLRDTTIDIEIMEPAQLGKIGQPPFDEVKYPSVLFKTSFVKRIPFSTQAGLIYTFLTYLNAGMGISPVLTHDSVSLEGAYVEISTFELQSGRASDLLKSLLEFEFKLRATFQTW